MRKATCLSMGLLKMGRRRFRMELDLDMDEEGRGIFDK